MRNPIQIGKLTILWLLTICLSASAQEKSYIFDGYSVNDGLSQSSVLSIIQDQEDFIWFSTGDGINQFDGYVFNEYRANPTFKKDGQKQKGSLLYGSAGKGRSVINIFGIGGTRNYRFYRDKRRQLLVSHNHGISLYDRYRNVFRNVFVDTSYVNEHERDFGEKFTILGEDSASLYVWRPLKGIYVLDNKDFEVKKLILYPPDYQKRKMTPLAAVKDGYHIWFNFQSGEMLRMDLSTARYATLCIPTVIGQPVVKVMGADSLLLVSNGHITVYNKKTNRYTDLPFDVRNIYGVPFMPTAVEFDSEHNVWIGGNNGILIYDLSRNEIVKHIVSFNTVESRSFNFVFSLYRDGADNMWVGLDGDGVKKYSPHKKVFNLYRSPYITHSMTKAIYKHEDGRLYVGLFQDGLDIFEKGGKFLKRISNEQTPGKFPAADLHAICREDHDRLWLHFRNAIGLFEVESEEFRDLTAKVNALGVPEQRDANPFVAKRSNGEVYFNWGEYLLMFTTADKGYNAAIVHRFDGENLSCFFEDFFGTVYIGTKAGIYYKTPDNSNWNSISLPAGAEVKSINKNAHKQLLVATNKGLFMFDNNHRIIKHYNSYDYPDIVNDYMYGVLLDDKDRIWVSSNRGLFQINPAAKDSIIVYNHEDGLQSNEFNTGSYYKSVDGELFFGGIRGVNGFYPRNLVNNKYPSRVVIRRLEVLDKPFASDTNIALLKKVSLAYNQNTIAIEYVPLEYTNPLKNRVKYMLEGADEDWLNAGNQRMARYTNLAPGHYVFKVKACNNDGIWNEEPTTLEINIKIPFWQSLWFRFLLLLLVLGGAYYLSALYLEYKIRNEKLKLEKEQAVDQERARISSDMHDDLGSGLSTIRLLSEIAKRKIKDSGQTKEIERISEAAGELVDKMSEIIWAMNSSNDSLANLLAYIRSFAADFLEHAHIKHHFIIPENIPNIKLSGGTRRNIYLAVKESLHNVMKHAQATEVMIEVNVQKNMMIRIKDNGKGFDPEKVRLFGNGLKNIQKRMEVVGGQAQIFSENGTTVLLDIPLN
ncbi:histidine kinase [Chitinophaga horti]|uniref:Histidine kinase n=1 Tax=Chitinophaga horti TaxID=2920382 RepID=A0ABY6J922_9BACT|nr:triple tyrosine motif-containing protein [Chitinophaga horti]UYQ94781.1 histidine kinase [Chitinophaga horti]